MTKLGDRLLARVLANRSPPADRYLAAVSALLMAMATSTMIDDETLDELLDAMPDEALRDGLALWIDEAGLRPDLPTPVEHD